MANTNSPLVSGPSGALMARPGQAITPPRGCRYTAGACNRGDVVKQLADGTVAVATVLGGAGNLGIFVGCPLSDGLARLPDLDELLAWALAPVGQWSTPSSSMIRWWCTRSWLDAGPITAANVGENADFVVTASTTGFSKWSLATPAVAAGSDVLPFKVVGIGNAGVNISDG